MNRNTGRLYLHLLVKMRIFCGHLAEQDWANLPLLRHYCRMVFLGAKWFVHPDSEEGKESTSKRKSNSDDIIYEKFRFNHNMCLMVRNSFPEAKEFLPPAELLSFNLDDIGCLVQCLYIFCAQATEVPRNLSHCTISKHDNCEDG
ncbi:unnamed protein product [Sphenostylis stenocarpa]|uniref:Uncharacterized protein n=1 Tax=Sphenostylis stenocarpa TaxID=92480 RepID=A0AA86SKA2_9FABA|nr:unnamed protein product [Sphenostylis stenocarpa]